METKFSIRIYDKNGDLLTVLDESASIDWEWNRIGGCGQADLFVGKNAEWHDEYLRPGAMVRVFIDDELRYAGRLVKPKYVFAPDKEAVSAVFYGFVSELANKVVRGDYENEEVSVIVKDILDNYIVGKSNITYDSADIEQTDYAVESLSLNHSVKDAMVLLANLAGNVEWGVDYNRKFFFKRQDTVTRRIYVIGADVDNYQEERRDEDVVNKINVYGAGGFITSITSTMSVSRFGRNSSDVFERNVFESAITENSDASRYGAVLLRALAVGQRSIKFRIARPDEFIERSTPIGAVAINRARFSSLTKYGENKKYGENFKYGNVRSDQFSNIRYTVSGGGLSVTATLLADVENLADSQKRIEYEIKELQRR